MTATTRTPRSARTTAESPSAAASRYQQLRSHLAELKLHAAAEALPAVLDQASAEGASGQVQGRGVRVRRVILRRGGSGGQCRRGGLLFGRGVVDGA